MNKTGFFEEESGVKSMIRLCSFILLLFFIFYNLPFAYANARAVIDSKPTAAFDPNYLAFNIILVASIFFPKLLQKIVELKFGGAAALQNSPEETLK